MATTTSTKWSKATYGGYRTTTDHGDVLDPHLSIRVWRDEDGGYWPWVITVWGDHIATPAKVDGGYHLRAEAKAVAEALVELWNAEPVTPSREIDTWVQNVWHTAWQVGWERTA